MSYTITQRLIPGLPKEPYRHGIGAIEGVVAHATAVWEDSAERQTNYFMKNWKKAFVHFFVDEQCIIQTADTNYRAWGAGKVANARYVHVELCQTRDRSRFLEAYKRYVWLLAKILYDKRLGVKPYETFWTHHMVTERLGGTTHEDPDDYLKYHGVTIDQLIQEVRKEYDRMSAPKVGAYDPNPEFHRNLAYNIPMMAGADVKRLQQRLEISADGIFGPLTRQAVLNWQKAHQGPYGVTGEVTKELWDVLFPKPPMYHVNVDGKSVIDSAYEEKLIEVVRAALKNRAKRVLVEEIQ
jgi:peptidoglycan hydrolase-like protein with peptidoglycan-binding domain